MHRLSFENLKLWLLAILLSMVTFFSYYKGISDPYGVYWKLPPVLYLLFSLVAVILYRRQEFAIKHQWHFVFIFGISVLNLIYVIYFGLPKYHYMLGTSVDQLGIIIISLILFSIVQPKVLSEILKRFYLVAFVVGIIFLFTTSIGYIGRHDVLNSNTWGFFLGPFLIYLFVSKRNIVVRSLVFIVGGYLLYLTEARTTMFIFLIFPLFMVLMKTIGRPRIIYTTLLISGLIITYLSAYAESELISDLLSLRDIIWKGFIDSSISNIPSFLVGKGEWRITLEESGSVWGAHNTFLSLLHYNGLIAMIFYLFFIVFGVRRRSKEFTVTDGIFFLAIAFQFSESNVGQFTYLFPSFIFLLNILLNKDEI